jgi:hypothetical protein
MPSSSIFQEILNPTNNSRLHSILARLELFGDVGLSADRIASIAGFSYWRASDKPGKKHSKHSKVFFEKLVKTGFISPVFVRFADERDIPKYRLTKKGSEKLSQLRGS